MIGWRPQQTILETARDTDALMDGRAREGIGLARENYGDRTAPGTLTDRRDAITLRCITAIWASVFGTHRLPTADQFRSADHAEP